MSRRQCCKRFATRKGINRPNEEFHLRLRLSLSLGVWITASLAGGGNMCAAILDSMDVKLTLAMREYCHIVRFPQGWTIPSSKEVAARVIFDANSEYEFRVEGLLTTRFLVGAFVNHTDREDATNRYRVNLSDPTAPALPATREAWEAAAVVPLTRKSIPRGLRQAERAEFKGFQFTKSGADWAGPFEDCRLSPDSAWLVLQSSTPNENLKNTLRTVYKTFWDVFNADTGRRILTIEGTFTGYDDDPGADLEKTGWLTERYFIVPLGQHKERCLVCEFGGRKLQQGAKP
jgi:hypothetical protein